MVLFQSFPLIVDAAQGLHDEASEQGKQEQRQSILSAVGFQKKSHLKAQKINQDPQSNKQNCAIQNHTDVNLNFKGLYITKNVSHNECEKSIQ